jgi:putative acetyltransferase
MRTSYGNVPTVPVPYLISAVTLDPMEASIENFEYPDAVDPGLVGTYPAMSHAGGGYVWDAVLEYRVWCHPERGAPDVHDGDDYYYAFATYVEALAFSEQMAGADAPLALIQQLEHIDEPEPGVYVYVKEPRITEWGVEFLMRPKRTKDTIPAFFAPDAPANRLDILRGVAVR